MSARRLALVGLLAGACTSSRPVPKDSDEPPPASLEDVPEDRPIRNRSLQLAAVSDGPLRITVLADQGIAVSGASALAFAPARKGQLSSDPKWRRGWPSGVLAIGGRWPDQAYVTAVSGHARSATFFAVWRWQDEAWTPAPIESAHPLVNFYSDYAGGADGAILGLRGFVVHSLDDDDDATRALQDGNPALRTTVDRLGDGPRPPWPPLPPGHEAVELLTFPDGTLVVLRTEPSLHRWSPGTDAWVELPAPLDRERREVAGEERPGVIGRAVDRLYVYRCTYEKQPWVDRLTAGAWQPIALPAGGCVTSLSEAPDGTLWLVNDRGLHRHPAPGPEPGEPGRWEVVPVGPIDVPGQPVAVLRGSEAKSWPPGPEPLVPRQVVALDRGEVWVVAGLGEGVDRGREVVLTTRVVIAPLLLRGLPEGTGSGP